MENLSESTKGNNANTLLAVGIRECLPDKHKRRDNKFGVTWCVKCGQLFTKPSSIPLQESDKVVYACR
jgi:ribosomal protein L37AE/L43A